MIDRRHLLGLAAGSVVLAAAPAFAQSWKTSYPELVLAVVPAENASGVTQRYQPFIEYLSKELGVKVTLRIANDYAAVIEGQRAGNVHLGAYGPASYSRAYITGVKIEPFSTTRNGDGSMGYYSVTYVLAKSSFHKMADLKGKTLALVDPNSTSGNNAPRYFLNRDGYDVDSFFGKNIYAGSHENAVLALVQGTVDAAANWWNADDDSNLTRMLKKGMLKNADGSPMKYEDFRIIYKSELLPNSPYAYLASLPADLKAAIRKAFAEAPTKAKAAFDKLSDGKDKEFVAIDHKAYVPIVEMIKYVDNMRKKRS
ncbi:MAG: phosphonate ABC transporter substrate-binding protein [Reyranellaceae bacterium]